MDFETKPVKDLSFTDRSQPRSPLRAAFAELPATRALFAPRTGRSVLKVFLNARLIWLARHFLDRKVHAHIDHEKDGIWLWWEPRETR